MSRRAFTLIELLVVIAIIAILAAILFPVFAQAKAAAKKTQDLSQMKQVGTAVQIYAGDHDDTLPLAYAVSPTGGWYTNSHIETPADWAPGYDATYYAENQTHVMNSTYPYVKSGEIFKSKAGRNFDLPGGDYGVAGAGPFRTNNVQYNGLLNGWSATAINQPSLLPLFSQNRGTANIRGYATSQPRLRCPSEGACVFQPSSPSCNGANGTWSDMAFFDETYSQWVHGRGQITVQADSSAKWRSMNGGVNTPSDFRTMYWTRFTANGGSRTEWQDTNFCHTMLFMPDFDFATFGTPVEY